MRKLFALVLVTSLVVGVTSSRAGMSCCGAKGKGGGADMAQCNKVFDSLNLTTEQKAKISTIQESCKGDKMSDASCTKAMSQIRDVLTPDQQAKFDAAMTKSEGAKPGEVKAGEVKPMEVKPATVKPST